MRASIPETVLPNGMKIFCLRKDEVPILYEQIQEYFRNGIELHEGDTVFDVGANIGLFTIWLYQIFQKNLSVYAFEPIPAIFEVLHRNAQRFGSEDLKVFPCGLSRESKTLTFGYYPKATTLSTAYPDGSKEERDKVKKALLYNFPGVPPFFHWLPLFLRSLILDHELKKAFQVKQVTCQLRTLSEIIREQGVQQIDLLKVDVEKSELEVLLGIEEQDWPKIKQIVVELHNLDHRVEKVTSLLKEHGFSEIIVEQEPAFKDSDIFNLYALRRKTG